MEIEDWQLPPWERTIYVSADDADTMARSVVSQWVACGVSLDVCDSIAGSLRDGYSRLTGVSHDCDRLDRRTEAALHRIDQAGHQTTYQEIRSMIGARPAHDRRYHACRLAARIAVLCAGRLVDHPPCLDVDRMAGVLLMASTVGTGGGLQNPGAGTTRLPAELTPELWDVYTGAMRWLRVPHGGGLSRRYATGGDAWTAAAASAARSLGIGASGGLWWRDASDLVSAQLVSPLLTADVLRRKALSAIVYDVMEKDS